MSGKYIAVDNILITDVDIPEAKLKVARDARYAARKSRSKRL